MNSKLCILVVIALCLTLVHAGGKYCPEPKGRAVPHEVQGQSMLQAKRLSKPVHLLQTAVRQRLLERVTCSDQRSSSEGWRTLRA
uniref:U21-Sparatoxin-Hju1b_1 n=1 Tax=Heteropoda jugulans TaxID=1358901 RepID=A0A4Q8K506_9ARAC